MRNSLPYSHRMDEHRHITVLRRQNAVKCERVTFACLSQHYISMASLGVTVLVCFLTLHCIGMASAERSRVSVEFAGSNHGVKGNIQIDGQTWFFLLIRTLHFIRLGSGIHKLPVTYFSSAPRKPTGRILTVTTTPQFYHGL